MEFYTNLVHYCKYVERYLNNKSEFTKKSYNCILTNSNDMTKEACRHLTQALHQSKQLNVSFNYDNFHFDFVSLFEYFYNEVLLKEEEFYAKENICLVFKILKAAIVNDQFCTNNFKFSDDQKTSLNLIYHKMIEVFNDNGKQDWLSEQSQNNSSSDLNILSDKEKALIDYMFSKLTSQFEILNKQSSQSSMQTNSSEVLFLTQETIESNRNLEKSKTRNRNVTFKSNYPEDATDRSNLNKIKTRLEKILRYENHIKVLNEHIKAGTAPSVMNVRFPPPLLPHDRISVDYYKNEIRNFHVNTMKMYTDRLRELIEEKKTEIAMIKVEQLKHLTDLDDIVNSLFIDLENSLKPKFVCSLEKANRIISKSNDLPFESNSNSYPNDCSHDSIGSLNFETEANLNYNRAYAYDEQHRTDELELSSNRFRTQQSMQNYGHLNSFNNNNFLNEQSNYNYNQRQQYSKQQPNHNRNNNKNRQLRRNSRNNSRGRQSLTGQSVSSMSFHNSRSNSRRFHNSRSNSRQSFSRNPIQNQHNNNFNVNRTSTPRTLRTNNNRNGNNNFSDSNYNKRYQENFQSQRRDHRPRPRN